MNFWKLRDCGKSNWNVVMKSEKKGVLQNRNSEMNKRQRAGCLHVQQRWARDNSYALLYHCSEYERWHWLSLDSETRFASRMRANKRLVYMRVVNASTNKTELYFMRIFSANLRPAGCLARANRYLRSNTFCSLMQLRVSHSFKCFIVFEMTFGEGQKSNNFFKFFHSIFSTCFLF